MFFLKVLFFVYFFKFSLKIHRKNQKENMKAKFMKNMKNVEHSIYSMNYNQKMTKTRTTKNFPKPFSPFRVF